MTFVGEEKKRLMADIKAFMLSQKGEFYQYPLVKDWIDNEKPRYSATLGSIRRYFSLCKDRLEDDGLIKHTRTEKLNNGNVRKYYKVV